jgi:hypothetical protein
VTSTAFVGAVGCTVRTEPTTAFPIAEISDILFFTFTYVAVRLFPQVLTLP